MNNERIINYYKGWPSTGKYTDDLNKIYDISYNYLYTFSYLKNNPKKPYTVIFDIDDTLVYTDPSNSMGYPIEILSNGKFMFPSIEQIAEIARLCKKLKFKIIILTARPYTSEESSKYNLNNLKIPYDEMYHNEKYPDLDFKIEFKQKLAKKHSLIYCIGDSWPDIKGINNCLCIKLPKPNDINAYYTFDNKIYTKMKYL